MVEVEGDETARGDASSDGAGSGDGQLPVFWCFEVSIGSVGHGRCETAIGTVEIAKPRSTWGRRKLGTGAHAR